MRCDMAVGLPLNTMTLAILDFPLRSQRPAVLLLSTAGDLAGLRDNSGTAGRNRQRSASSSERARAGWAVRATDAGLLY